MRKKHRIYLSGILILGLSILLVSCAKENPNKLSCELLPVEGNPLVSFRILLKVGSAHDPQGKEGLCQLTCSLLANGGTKDLTFKEIQKKFYPMATSVGLNVEKEMSVFTGQVHLDNLEKYYGILKAMLLDPGFRKEDFQRIKTNQINFLEKTLVGNRDEQFGKEILNLIEQCNLLKFSARTADYRQKVTELYEKVMSAINNLEISRPQAEQQKGTKTI